MSERWVGRAATEAEGRARNGTREGEHGGLKYEKAREREATIQTMGDE